MSRRKTASLLASYGFREESTSLFEKIARDGIAATAASRMGLRDDPTGHLGLIPIESALAAQRGQPIPPQQHIHEARLYFYHYPNSMVNHRFLPSQYLLARTRNNGKFLLRFPLAPLRKWRFYPDGALAPGKGSYFVLPDVTAGKMVVQPNVIEVLCADLLWRSFFWNACLRARPQRTNLPIDVDRLKSL
jgi:hypothetical protein